LTEFAYLCERSVEFKKLDLKYDVCVGDVVGGRTIYQRFYNMVLIV